MRFMTLRNVKGLVPKNWDEFHYEINSSTSLDDTADLAVVFYYEDGRQVARKISLTKSGYKVTEYIRKGKDKKVI